MLNAIERLLISISKFVYHLGIYLVVPLLVVLISIDVALRYGFNSPLIWGNEVSALLLLLVFFSLLPYCTYQKGHIRMDLLYNKFGPGLKRSTVFLSSVCGLLFSVLLTYQAFISSFEMYEWNEGAEMIDIPYWPFMVLVCFCSAVLTIQFIIQLLKAILGTDDVLEVF